MSLEREGLKLAAHAPLLHSPWDIYWDETLGSEAQIPDASPTLPRHDPSSAHPQARDNLELSFVNEADMVFTTLSSTGRRVFERMQNRFETVLVDEAAQASEIAIMQPLTFGCKRCALPITGSSSVHL